MRFVAGNNAARRIVESVLALGVVALCAAALGALDAFAGAWTPPQPLSPVGGTGSSGAQDFASRETAVAPDGSAVAVWLRSDGPARRVEARVRRPGGRFRDAQLLSAPGVDVSNPQLALGPDGQGIAMWESGGAVQYALLAAHETAFGPVQAPAPGTLGGLADVVIGSTGDTVAVWALQDQVRVSLRPPGGSFGPSEALDSLDRHGVAKGFFGAPVVAADRKGNVYAAWAGSAFGVPSPDSSSSRAWVSAATRPPSGPFGPQQEIGGDGCLPGSPRIGAGAGGAIVTWVCTATSPSGIASVNGVVLPAGGTAGAAGELSPEQPAGVIGADGTAVAGWSASGEVRFAITPPGAAGSGAVATGQPGTGVRLAADGSGRVFAVWGGAASVQAAIKEPGGQFGRLTAISGVLAASGTADIAADDAGNALATWVQAAGAGGRQVFYSAYDGAGPDLRALRAPKRSRTGRQIRFSVLPLDTWSPIRKTVWRFGDGRRKSGASVVHTYKYAGGRMRLKVTATDAAGNSTTRRRWIRIRDLRRPRIRAFRWDGAGRLRFRLTEKATVRIYVTRRAGGRYHPYDTLVRKRRRAGGNRVTFRGGSGRYRATIWATDPSRNRSKLTTLAFRVPG